MSVNLNYFGTFMSVNMYGLFLMSKCMNFSIECARGADTKERMLTSIDIQIEWHIHVGNYL